MRIKELRKAVFMSAFIAIAMLLTVDCSFGAIEKGPYLQNVGKNYITIMWETLYATESRVEYGLTEDYGLFVENSTKKDIHEITLRALMPGTKYYYKITSGFSSKNAVFRTAPDHAIPFKFIVYGDTQANPDIHRSIARHMLKIEPDLILHTGDLVSNGTRYSQWEALFFEPIRDVIDHIPIFTALGNHDRNANYYFKFLSLPNNESWYSFDYSNCHFIALDSNKDFSKNSKQYKWLKNDLENAQSRWKFVFFHHPPYTSGRHPSDLRARNILTPLFRKHGVDIVFCGHNHQYERSYPITSAVRSDDHPVTYIVSGGAGGNLYDFGTGNPWTREIVKTHNFCIVSIDGEELKFRSLNVDGNKLDEFAIAKDQDRYEQYAKDAIYYEQIEFERELPANITPPVALLDGGRDQIQGAIQIKNTSSNAIDFNIKWDDPGNWGVEPAQDTAAIAGGENARLLFSFRPPGSSVWPSPRFSVIYDTGLFSGELARNYLKILIPRKLICKGSKDSIKINGRLEEQFWNDAPSASGFIRTDSSDLAAKQTAAKVIHGKDSLYVAFVCSEPEPKNLSATVSTRDGDIPADESVIVSIAPHSDDKMVYQFGVNCEDVRYDAKGGIEEWNGRWEAEARINDDNWVVEMSIPYTVLELLSPPKKGNEWGINFFRITNIAPEKSKWSNALNCPLTSERLTILLMD